MMSVYVTCDAHVVTDDSDGCHTNAPAKTLGTIIIVAVWKFFVKLSTTYLTLVRDLMMSVYVTCDAYVVTHDAVMDATLMHLLKSLGP